MILNLWPNNVQRYLISMYVFLIQEVKNWAYHAAKVNGVAFSPNGRYLATCSIDTYVNIWDIDAGYIVHKMRGKVTRKMFCSLN